MLALPGVRMNPDDVQFRQPSPHRLMHGIIQLIHAISQPINAYNQPIDASN